MTTFIILTSMVFFFSLFLRRLEDAIAGSDNKKAIEASVEESSNHKTRMLEKEWFPDWHEDWYTKCECTKCKPVLIAKSLIPLPPSGRYNRPSDHEIAHYRDKYIVHKKRPPRLEIERVKK